MKRILSGIALAVIAMLSSCENIELQEQDAYAESQKVLFTATLGTDTKTYLEWNGSVYKTLWDDDDAIYVFDAETGDRELCRLVEGAGTPSATFAGTLEADRYVAIYAENAYHSRGSVYEMYLSSWQNNSYEWQLDGSPETEKYVGRWTGNQFAMVAESSDRDFSFTNLCSVLKLSITGNDDDYLNAVTIESNDSSVPMCGRMMFDMNQQSPVFDKNDCSSSLEVAVWKSLSASVPIEVYAVLPAQTYYGGFTLTFNADRETRKYTVTDNIVMKRSHIRNIDISLGDGLVVDPEEPVWSLIGSMSDWSEDVLFAREDDWWILRGQFFKAGDEFKLRYNRSWDICLGRVNEGTVTVDAPTKLGEGPNLLIGQEGTYDLWFDEKNEYLYVLTSGLTPDDIGEISEIWQMEVTYDNGGSWETFELEEKDGILLLEDVYFGNYAQLRFFEKTSGTWYLCPASYQNGIGKTNTRVDLLNENNGGWWWFAINNIGVYDIYLDAAERCVYMMSDGHTPQELPTNDTVLVEKFDDIYKIPVGEKYVKICGPVMAKTSYGFIVAMNSQYFNNVYVYDKGLCGVELGNYIDLYAKVDYYRELPELVVTSGAYWCHLLSTQIVDYSAEEPYLITDLSTYSSAKYEYIRFVGTLNDSVVSAADSLYNVYITLQDQIDLNEYNGKTVCVEGYYLGNSIYNNTITRINIALKRIGVADTEGSLGDVLPGDDIIVTRACGAGSMNQINR